VLNEPVLAQALAPWACSGASRPVNRPRGRLTPLYAGNGPYGPYGQHVRNQAIMLESWRFWPRGRPRACLARKGPFWGPVAPCGISGTRRRVCYCQSPVARLGIALVPGPAPITNSTLVSLTTRNGNGRRPFRPRGRNYMPI